MSIRIDDIDELTTEELLTKCLHVWLSGNRAMFLVPPGAGYNVMQRLRVKLSRNRKQQARDGQKRMYFTVHHSTHPHTEQGKRYEAVICWRTQSQEHRMIESLEDMVGHGAAL